VPIKVVITGCPIKVPFFLNATIKKAVSFG